jgi:hypothetical protein
VPSRAALGTGPLQACVQLNIYDIPGATAGQVVRVGETLGCALRTATAEPTWRRSAVAWTFDALAATALALARAGLGFGSSVKPLAVIPRA